MVCISLAHFHGAIAASVTDTERVDRSELPARTSISSQLGSQSIDLSESPYRSIAKRRQADSRLPAQPNEPGEEVPRDDGLECPDPEEDGGRPPKPLLRDGSATSSTSYSIVQELIKLFLQDPRLEEVFSEIAKSWQNHSIQLRHVLECILKAFGHNLRQETTRSLYIHTADYILRKSALIAGKLSTLKLSDLEKSRLDFKLVGITLMSREKVDHYLLLPDKDGLLDQQKASKIATADEGNEELDAEDGNGPQELQNEWQVIVNFIKNSVAMDKMLADLEELTRPRPASTPVTPGPSKQTLSNLAIWQEIRDLWRTHSLGEPPVLLRTLYGSQLELFGECPLSVFDRLRLSLERYSGSSWDWWPLNPPTKYVRTEWKPLVGEVVCVDVPVAVAYKLRDLLVHVSAGGDPEGYLGTARMHASAIIPSSEISVCQRHRAVSSTASPLATDGGSGPALATVSSPDVASKTIHYVLFCAFRGECLSFSQINVSMDMDEDSFTTALWSRYRSMVGFWRYWLRPEAFHFCTFAKFTRTARGCLIKHRVPELPVDNDEYVYIPPARKGEPFVAPIQEHEWNQRLYRRIYEPNCRCALVRIPKRKRRFVFYEAQSGREDMWGLLASTRPSFLRVLLWSIVITLAGWVFLAWWLAKHNGDWQNAGTPMALIIMAMTWLWMPLNHRFRQKF